MLRCYLDCVAFLYTTRILKKKKKFIFRLNAIMQSTMMTVLLLLCTIQGNNAVRKCFRAADGDMFVLQADEPAAVSGNDNLMAKSAFTTDPENDAKSPITIETGGSDGSEDDESEGDGNEGDDSKGDDSKGDGSDGSDGNVESLSSKIQENAVDSTITKENGGDGNSSTLSGLDVEAQSLSSKESDAVSETLDDKKAETSFLGGSPMVVGLVGIAIVLVLVAAVFTVSRASSSSRDSFFLSSYPNGSAQRGCKSFQSEWSCEFSEESEGYTHSHRSGSGKNKIQNTRAPRPELQSVASLEIYGSELEEGESIYSEVESSMYSELEEGDSMYSELEEGESVYSEGDSSMYSGVESSTYSDETCGPSVSRIHDPTEQAYVLPPKDTLVGFPGSKLNFS